MSRRKLNPWLLVAFIGGLFYPLLAYWGLNVFPPLVFVFLGLGLMGIRLLGLQKTPDVKVWNGAFMIAATALLALSLINSHMAALFYPVIINLLVGTIFGLSLLFPPPLIERIARYTEPNLPQEGVIYTRRVTVVWTVFLALNTLISAGTVLWGSLAAWTLWNGFISYILMGGLFMGEFAFRQVVRARTRARVRP